MNRHLPFTQGKGTGCVATVIVLAGAGTLAFLFSDTLQNQVRLAFADKSPEKYAAWVYQHNAGRVAKSMEQSAGLARLEQTKKGADTCITFEPSDYLIGTMSPEHKLDVFDFGFMPTPSDIDTISLRLNSGMRNGINGSTAQVSVNDHPLFTLESVSVAQDPNTYIRLPELSETWLGMPPSAVTEDDELAMSGNPNMMDYSKEAMADALRRYTAVLTDNTSRVALEKRTSVLIGSEEYKYTAMTVTLEKEQLTRYVEAILDEAKDDAVLKDQLMTAGAVEEANYIATLEKLRRSLADALRLYTNTVSLVTYVDKSGQICGIAASDLQQNGFRMLYGVKAKHVNGLLSYQSGQAGNGKLVLNGDVTASGVNGDLKGELVLPDFGQQEAGSRKLDVTFQNLTWNPVDGIVSGNIALDSGTLNLAATLGKEDGAQMLRCDITDEGNAYGTVTLRIAEAEAPELRAPAAGNVYCFNPETEKTIDLSKIATQQEAADFLCGVYQGLGVSETAARASANLLTGLLYLQYREDTTGLGDLFGGIGDKLEDGAAQVDPQNPFGGLGDLFSEIGDQFGDAASDIGDKLDDVKEGLGDLIGGWFGSN